MTVAELIAELRKQPQGHEIWLVIENTSTTIDRISLDSMSRTVDLIGEDA